MGRKLQEAGLGVYVWEMDVLVRKGDEKFVWDSDKAASNLRKHGITFDRACEAILDPISKLVDAESDDEARDAILGEDFARKLLYVVHISFESGWIRLISAREATAQERKSYAKRN